MTMMIWIGSVITVNYSTKQPTTNAADTRKLPLLVIMMKLMHDNDNGDDNDNDHQDRIRCLRSHKWKRLLRRHVTSSNMQSCLKMMDWRG